MASKFEHFLGDPHDATPESEPLRQKAKWHAERAGGLKNAKISKVGSNIYHAELEERSHPGHSERNYHPIDGTDKWAFRS